jgi:hypothetical protein
MGSPSHNFQAVFCKKLQRAGAPRRQFTDKNTENKILTLEEFKLRRHLPKAYNSFEFLDIGGKHNTAIAPFMKHRFVKLEGDKMCDQRPPFKSLQGLEYLDLSDTKVGPKPPFWY